MRTTDDPLERWLHRDEGHASPQFAAAQLHATQVALEKLETYLRQPDKKTSLYGLGLPDYVHPGLLPRAEVAWAEKPMARCIRPAATGARMCRKVFCP